MDSCATERCSYSRTEKRSAASSENCMAKPPTIKTAIMIAWPRKNVKKHGRRAPTQQKQQRTLTPTVALCYHTRNRSLQSPTQQNYVVGPPNIFYVQKQLNYRNLLISAIRSKASEYIDRSASSCFSIRCTLFISVS